jgi:hypothetical protein
MPQLFPNTESAAVRCYGFSELIGNKVASRCQELVIRYLITVEPIVVPSLKICSAGKHKT